MSPCPPAGLPSIRINGEHHLGGPLQSMLIKDQAWGFRVEERCLKPVRRRSWEAKTMLLFFCSLPYSVEPLTSSSLHLLGLSNSNYTVTERQEADGCYRDGLLTHWKRTRMNSSSCSCLGWLFLLTCCIYFCISFSHVYTFSRFPAGSQLSSTVLSSLFPLGRSQFKLNYRGLRGGRGITAKYDINVWK